MPAVFIWNELIEGSINHAYSSAKQQGWLMQLNSEEQNADQAAARGEITEARDILERIVAVAPERINTWLKLAALRRAGGDLPGAFAAVSAALRIDPLHFTALLSRAKLHEANNEPDEAARNYLRALAQLREGEDAGPGLRSLIEHARRVSSAYQQRVAADWMALIDADALDPATHAKMARFTSNALRQTRPWHSDPTHYHYPGLAEREFHDTSAFGWIAALEAAAADIRDEFLTMQTAPSSRAEPYVQYSADTPVRQWARLNHSLDWTAFHLFYAGRECTENTARCPKTMAMLRAIDQPHITGRAPNAMFSLLQPQTRIPPHTGIANTRLVCHLPLIVPDNCWFRVGAERREWREGEALIFDDTIEHEAANDSGEPRVVLIFDLWHPDLSAPESAAIACLMEADERAGGTAI